jgi:hypothetical protein
MTKIKKKEAYPLKVNIVESDFVPGSDSESNDSTVSFSFEAIRSFAIAGLSPDIGGTLKITEITYSGGLDSPSDVLNNLNPSYIVLRYHLIVVSVNGYKWILKLQNITVGVSQTPVADSDFIEIPTSVGPAGKGISSIVKTNTVGLVDTYTITYTDSSTSNFNVTNGSQGVQGIQGIPGVAGNGITSIAKTSTVGLVDTYTITFSNATTTTFPVTNGSNGTNGTNAVNDNQKILTYPDDFTAGNYTLVNGDNDYTIFIENGANAVSITVPAGLTSKFQVGIIHRGTSDITYIASGTTVTNPVGLKSKGTGYSQYLIQKGSTNVFNLLGNTKV